MFILFASDNALKIQNKTKKSLYFSYAHNNQISSKAIKTSWPHCDKFKSSMFFVSFLHVLHAFFIVYLMVMKNEA